VAVTCALLLASPALAAPRKKSSKDEAAAISQVAARKHEAGDFALCANLYHQAYRTDSTYLGYLFSAARCAQKAGDLDGAERDYRLFLELSPDGEPLNEKAHAFLTEVAEARKVAEAQKKAAEEAEASRNVVVPPLVVIKPAPPQESHALAWTATVGGGLLVVAGGVLIAQAASLRSDLKAQLSHHEPGLVVGLTPAQAHDQESTYRTRMGLGTGVAVLGLAAAGAGIWLFGRPQQVTLVPGPTAAGAGLAFAWR
jgi:tetratricopeptide (TPR) repeat protein